jgi:hypothetical protein
MDRQEETGEMGRQEDQVRCTRQEETGGMGRQEDQVRWTGRKKQAEWADRKIR